MKNSIQIVSRRVLSLSATVLLAAIVLSPPSGDLVEESRRPAGLFSPPGFFIQNRGQWSKETKFVAMGRGFDLFCGEKGWTLTTPEGKRIRFSFPASSATPALVPGPRLEGRFHFFTGNDPGWWKRDVPAFSSLEYVDVLPGLDIALKPRGEGFEYDLIFHPGAKPEDLSILLKGADSLALAPDGSLLVKAGKAAIRQPLPKTWMIGKGGNKVSLPCRYDILPGNRVGFRVHGWDSRSLLVIDPVLLYSTPFGGSKTEFIVKTTRAPNGDLVAVGRTGSADFPTTPGAFQRYLKNASSSWPWDVFVLRWNPATGKIVYGTFLGGNLEERPTSFSLLPSGAVLVAGSTTSPSFPTTAKAFQGAFGGARDGFVTILGPKGDRLLASTFLGGKNFDAVQDLALGPKGDIFLTGETTSTDFPTTKGSWDPKGHAKSSSSDAFVARLKPDLSSLVYSTYLGGGSSDQAYALSVDGRGRAVVAGITQSWDFPTTPWAYNRSTGGGINVFIARIKADGSFLDFSTYIADKYIRNSSVTDLRLGPKGDIFCCGWVDSPDFPVTKGAYQEKFGKGAFRNGFIFRLSGSGSSLVYSTYFGGTATTVIEGLAVEPDGSALFCGGVSGSAQWIHFPLTANALDKVFAGKSEGFIAELGPMGAGLRYCSFVGGKDSDSAESVELDSQGRILLSGYTFSSDFPTTKGALKKPSPYQSDAFAYDFRLLPVGVRRFGHSTPSCRGYESISVLSQPKAGNKNFGFTCANAPPYAFGVLLVGGKGLVSPWRISGVDIFLDPSWPPVTLFVASDQKGTSSTIVPIPAGTSGVVCFGQYVWFNTPNCGGSGTLSASDALEIKIQ